MYAQAIVFKKKSSNLVLTYNHGWNHCSHVTPSVSVFRREILRFWDYHSWIPFISFLHLPVNLHVSTLILILLCFQRGDPWSCPSLIPPPLLLKPFILILCVSLCLFLCVCLLSLCFFLSLSASDLPRAWKSVCRPLFPYVSLSMALCLYMPCSACLFSWFLYGSLSLFLFLCLPVSFSLWVCFCFSTSLCICFTVSVSLYFSFLSPSPTPISSVLPISVSISLSMFVSSIFIY